MTMPILPLTLQLLAICGCWRPAFCSSPCRKAIYNVFSAFVAFLVYSLMFVEIIGICQIDNIDNLIENSYLPLSIACACCKMANLLIYRGHIAELIDSLVKDPHKPANAIESLIRVKYDKIVRTNTIRYAVMIETSVISSIVNSFMIDYRNKKLPYGDWLPYDYSDATRFCVTYFYQVLSMIAASFVHVCADALICGIFIHMYCQIEILEYRIKNIKKQHDILRKCIRHHDGIYRLAARITTTFQIMIFSQFLISALVLCVTLCQLLKKDILSTEFLALMIYISTLLLQIFIYCWYANEVKLKSTHISEIIFKSDWTELNNSYKQDLMFMMQRAIYPVEFNFLHTFDVNLDSFMNLIKSSYSVYNILQQSKL